MNLLLLMSLLVSFFNVNAQEDVVLCTERFCDDFLENNNCTRGSRICNTHNSTNNGLELPSPDPCNCCTYCLEYLGEGDFCSVGETGGLVPTSICGPSGLTCKDGLCIKMITDLSSDCTKKQNDYDQRRKDGILGSLELRPNCDSDGYYEPYMCIPGLTCFCVDKYGRRIFGEISYTSTASFILRCECSRKYYQAIEFLGKNSLHPNEHFRCTANGDYDIIQCIGENCMCVDVLDGAPTYPTAASVKPALISNDTLKECFNPERHMVGAYFYSCAAKYLEILEEVKEYEAEGYSAVLEVAFPNCDLDGKYAPVQKDEKDDKTSANCYNSDGTTIGSYSARGSDVDQMDCKCARTTLLLPKESLEKPDCCSNGNFNPVQCRRGKCYCVDENGYQNDPTECDISSKDCALPCNNCKQGPQVLDKIKREL